MENTKNKLTQEEIIFFQNIKIILETRLYFYGSIQRYDYLSQYSDIDVDIFTNDEKGTIIKLQNYLNVKKTDLKKTLCIMFKSSIIIPGYKLKYIDKDNKINVEFSIFNERYKNQVIESQKIQIETSYFICLMILFLKILYYELNVIPFKIFRKMKNYLLGITNKDKQNYIIMDMD
jgi:hypothetical protein